MSQENKNLRALLKLNLDNNSYKSFAEEILKMENEIRRSNSLSPSRKQEETDKGQKKSMMKLSIRERAKRVKRKRTESFHYSSFGETSPEEEERETSTLNKLRRKSVRTNMFTSGYSLKLHDAEQNKNEEKKENEEKKKKEEKKEISSKSASSSSSSSEEDKEEKESKNDFKIGFKMTATKTKEPITNWNKRARFKSYEQANNFGGLSPPNNNKRKISKIDDNSGGDYFAIGLKKGGGYKMSMSQIDEVPSGENKEQTDFGSNFSMSVSMNKETTENMGDDYMGCFNKNKVKKSPERMQKKVRRAHSMAQDLEDRESRELSSSKFKVPPKIKYSIHSIIEEEKSKSSSSASSVRSSDDLAFYFNHHPNPNKRKRSSFWKKSLQSSSLSNAQESESSGQKSSSSRKLISYKTKKYTDAVMKGLMEGIEKPKTIKKKRRRNSMAIVMSNLDSE